MKKGKPKPYVKKDSKKDQYTKYMIYIVIGIMVFSAVYFGLRSAEPESKSSVEGLKITQYNVGQAGSDILLVITEERPELIAMMGEKARVDSNTIIELMNTTASTVYATDGEIALNSYVFFRFYTANIEKSVEELTPKLNSLVGDYRFYRGYIGVQPGDTAMTAQVYLLGPLNLSRGSLVKILLLEKLSNNNRTGWIGFVKNVIPFGPKVNANVNSIEGLMVSGLTKKVQDVDEINRSIPDVRSINYQPPMVIIKSEINETTLNLSGVEVVTQPNSTVVRAINQTIEEVTKRLDEIKLEYVTSDGFATIAIPTDSDLTSIEESLREMNITNMTERKYGSIALPEEVAMNGAIVPIENNRNFTAVLFTNASKGEGIVVELYVIQFGDQYVVNAQQI
ncbi:MAG: hypothetical protein V1703_02280 [Candidatus Altiarchaeota archaeon]